MFRALILTVFMLFNVPVVAKTVRFDFNANCVTAYNFVLNLEFSKAGKIITEEAKQAPDNVAIAWVSVKAAFMKAFISEQESDYVAFKNEWNTGMEQLEKLPPTEPWNLAARSELLLQLAIIKLKRKEYIPAGYYIRKAFRMLEESKSVNPQFVPTLKLSGFMHAAVGAVPENYKWLSNLAGMNGTIASGAKELEQAAEHAKGEWSFLSLEICFLRVYIASHLEKNPVKAKNILDQFTTSGYESSPLLIFLQVNTQLSGKKQTEALSILRSYQPASTVFRVHYFSYLEGMLLLQSLDMHAESHFKSYVENYKGTSFIKSAWQKLAWLKLLQNDQQGYQSMLKQVESNGSDLTDEDKQALHEALSDETPNVYLLRSRLLFDGNDYNRALAELAGKPASAFSLLRDKLEFTYRLARIFDEQQQDEKAVEYYTLTFENGKSNRWYFAANSALMLGNMYEEKKDFILAASWYDKCLALREHEYQNSIDQKAKAGKNRIEGR